MTKRMTRCIDLSRHCYFNQNDISELYDIIFTAFCLDPYDEYLSDLLESIQEIKSNGYVIDSLTLDEPEINDTHLYHLNLLQYLLVNNRSAWIFLVDVPYDRVPLYINHPKIGLFAKWRLKIGK